MIKDIFIDNNVAKNFCNPLDSEYINLIKWLIKYDHGFKQDNAYLVISKKILGEYYRTSANSYSGTNIVAIIGKMQKEGRLIIFTNEEIKEFKRRNFQKRIVKRLRCNIKDRDHIPVVLMSNRKYALCRDKNLVYDLNNFPRFRALVALKPQDIPYDK